MRPPALPRSRSACRSPPSQTRPLRSQSNVGSSTILPVDLARLDQPVRLGGTRQRQQPLDLRLDLAFGRGREASVAVGRMIARPALDGDLVVVEMGEVDGHVRSGMRAGGHQPAAEAERVKGLRQHLGVGDIVVEHVDAACLGELHRLGADVLRVVVDAVVGAELRSPGGRGRPIRRPRSTLRADHVLGDLDAGHAEIAARPMIRRSRRASSLAVLTSKFQAVGAWRMITAASWKSRPAGTATRCRPAP